MQMVQWSSDIAAGWSVGGGGGAAAAAGGVSRSLVTTGSSCYRLLLELGAMGQKLSGTTIAA
jgi:hypothetical protein